MARAHGVSDSIAREIRRQHRLPPHRVDRFKYSKGPRFAENLQDLVGLSLNPPERAVVFCVDAKPHILALHRTRPVLPLHPRMPERQSWRAARAAVAVISL